MPAKHGAAGRDGSVHDSALVFTPPLASNQFWLAACALVRTHWRLDDDSMASSDGTVPERELW